MNTKNINTDKNNVDIGELRQCAAFLAELIVSDPDKYGPLMIMYERYAREIETRENNLSKLDLLRLQVEKNKAAAASSNSS
ncbi:hypothetical protein [Bartonella choladocola]|uniref:Uncharacterized protein n=1 Tax=Bartonella choladocola TaxID=2750995 RepID=A0A1U9MJN7_9HYPH|nr:hypothetical protein [Bartonella choladocola]AQT47933.1 hypothetical protein BBC0122_018360 [Bartonella choladocola]